MSEPKIPNASQVLIELISRQGERPSKHMLASMIGEVLEYTKWMEEIPYIQFPPEWQIKIIPPFAGATARFLVKTKDMKDEDRISIYLDCYDYLGAVGQPYWEIYPVDGDTDRVLMNDTEGLLASISRALKGREG